jgi:hypothetical protein
MGKQTDTTPSSSKAWKTAMRALDTATGIQGQAAKVVVTAVATITQVVNANDAAAVAESVPGAALGDAVIVNPAEGIQGLAVSAFVDSAGSVTIVLSNPKAAPITITAIDFDIMVLRKGTT